MPLSVSAVPADKSMPAAMMMIVMPDARDGNQGEAEFMITRMLRT